VLSAFFDSVDTAEAHPTAYHPITLLERYAIAIKPTSDVLHMKPTTKAWSVLAGVVLFDLVSVTLAHGHDEDASMEMSSGMNISEVPRPHIYNITDMGPPSYFRHPEYSGLMLLHIVLMTMAWIFVLPLGTSSHCFSGSTVY
jgi:protein-S-isoprenylcysteine O-methyltransferase Ste14